MVSLQLGRKQDFFVQGQVGDMHYLGVMDGHGGHACINYVRTLDFDFIASQPDPAQTLWDMVQSQRDFYGSGCTFTFARITHHIEVWNVGDSLTSVFLNEQVFTSEIHTFLNPREVERTKPFMERLTHTTSPQIVDQHMEDMPSIVGHFFTGDRLVPSQSIGHNGCTGFAPHKLVIPYKPTDRIRIVCVSDGVTDMKVDLAEGSALDIVQEAQRKWTQPWLYRGHETKFSDIDDISCVVWDNKVVEIPSICIPYSPALITKEVVQHYW
jgi:serine/threonine protein phosphatase PrpC